VTLWNVTHPEHTALAGRTQAVPADDFGAKGLAFSPKGHLLATSSQTGTIRLWAVSASGVPTYKAVVSVPAGPITTLSFSPDERLLATGGDDDLIRLWDVSDPARPAAFGQPLSGHTGAVNTVVFAPTAPLLISDSDDNTVRLWPTEPAYDTDLVCTASAGTLTPAEGKLHLSGLPYDPPCP
jgi:WD40 repeat protein